MIVLVFNELARQSESPQRKHQAIQAAALIEILFLVSSYFWTVDFVSPHEGELEPQPDHGRSESQGNAIHILWSLVVGPL